MEEQASANSNAPREHPGGFLYLLSNASMPSLFKIGQTNRNPYVRIEELSAATGVPMPYALVLAVFVKDRVNAEIALHAALEWRRLSSSREFFRFRNEAEARDEVLSVLKGRSVAVAGREGTRMMYYDPIPTDPLGSDDQTVESLLSEIEEARIDAGTSVSQRDELDRRCRVLTGEMKSLRDELASVRGERNSIRAERDMLKHQEHMQAHVWRIIEWCKANPSRHVHELTDLLMRGQP